MNSNNDPYMHLIWIKEINKQESLTYAFIYLSGRTYLIIYGDKKLKN